jgi:hypothetical protein
MVRHCPRCDLRFASASELTEHQTIDHEPGITVGERFHYPTRRSLQPLYADLVEPSVVPPRRYLVIANQTLHSPELEAEVLQRIGSVPVEFVVLVPATHSADYAREPFARPVEAIRPATDEAGLAQARWRLRQTVEVLRRAGAAVYGQLGPADPFEAAMAIVERQHVDEVIMSTLAPDRSRWAAMDVPARIRRQLGVPVIVVAASLGRTPVAAE